MAGRLISWKNDAKRVQVTRQQWNKIVEGYANNPEFERVNYTDERRYRFVRWFGKYMIDAKNDKYPVLYVGTPSGDLFRFTTNAIDDEKNVPHIGGYEAFRMVTKDFRRLEGVAFNAAFGEVTRDFKRFVKPAIIQVDPRFSLQNCYGTYKADVSSAYPAAACGALPDASSMMRIKGRVAPSKEYPFAFYEKSGHLAEYGKYDSHKWLGTFYRKYITFEKGEKQRDDLDARTVAVEPDDEITILMRSAGYSLTKTMKMLYNRKVESDDVKQAMVAFFGFCQSVNFNKGKYAHIVAVVYARHIQRMIEFSQKLRDAGCVPLMYATDSIAWRGKPPEGLCVEPEKKSMGAFVLEYKNAVLRYKACGVYALQDLKTGNIYLVKHQGIKLEDAKLVKRLRDVDDLPSTATGIDKNTGKIMEVNLENGKTVEL